MNQTEYIVYQNIEFLYSNTAQIVDNSGLTCSSKNCVKHVKCQLGEIYLCGQHYDGIRKKIKEQVHREILVFRENNPEIGQIPLGFEIKVAKIIFNDDYIDLTGQILPRECPSANSSGKRPNLTMYDPFTDPDFGNLNPIKIAKPKSKPIAKALPWFKQNVIAEVICPKLEQIQLSIIESERKLDIIAELVKNERMQIEKQKAIIAQFKK